MKRREFITLLGGAVVAWPLAARAQQTGRVWRVALIGAVSPLPAMLSAFREALQQRGGTEGKNLSIDVRWPRVSFAQEPGLISEVLHSNVDVIVAWSTPSALAARRATSTIPIVFLGVSDPVGSGLAASLPHPGGNATGSSNVAPDLSAKLVGMFAQLVPGMSSVGAVVNPANPGAVAQMDGTQQAVHALGLQSQLVNAGTLAEYERAFARLKIDGVNGVLLLADPSQDAYAGKIAELAQQYRLPTAFQLRNSVVAGGLMSYGADNNDQFRLAAFYVDRILRGEKPADLPVQMPTKFVFAINLKTAKALGITVPPTLLAIADLAQGFNMNGFNGGGYGGCDYQVGVWVFGIEGDWSIENKSGQAGPGTTALASNLATPTPLPQTVYTEAQERWYATARGRLGYAVDKWLFFVSGGAAWTKVDSSYSVLGTPAGGSGATYFALQNDRRSGWTAGGGFDYALTTASLMPGWSLRVEYLYINFGSYNTFTNPTIAAGPAGPTGPYIFNLNTKLTDNVLRVGLSYKFGNYAAPVAYK